MDKRTHDSDSESTAATDRIPVPVQSFDSETFSDDCLVKKNVKSQSRRVVLASVVGNVLEWYDFGVFAFLAPQIGFIICSHKF